jgi:hypothetical protein
MSLLWLVVLVVGASARLTRLVTRDTLTSPFRAWTIRRWGPDSKPATLLTCPWCAGFWLCAAVAASGWWARDAWWWSLPALTLTASYAVGLLDKLDG